MGIISLTLIQNLMRTLIHIIANDAWANSLIKKEWDPPLNLPVNKQTIVSLSHSPEGSTLYRYLITRMWQLMSQEEVCRWWVFSCNGKYRQLLLEGSACLTRLLDVFYILQWADCWWVKGGENAHFCSIVLLLHYCTTVPFVWNSLPWLFLKSESESPLCPHCLRKRTLLHIFSCCSAALRQTRQHQVKAVVAAPFTANQSMQPLLGVMCYNTQITLLCPSNSSKYLLFALTNEQYSGFYRISIAAYFACLCHK